MAPPPPPSWAVIRPANIWWKDPMQALALRLSCKIMLPIVSTPVVS